MDVATGTPDTTFIDPLLRRRLSTLGRGMVHCAGQVAGDIPHLRSVFASRHGEPARTMPMLEDLAQSLEISPTQFSMNVHNAVAGIWSISRRDRSASTAVGAGAETFGWGLLEAYSLHLASHGEPVLFVYGDDRLPEALSEWDQEQTPLHALALLIALPAQGHLILQKSEVDEASSWTSGQSLHCLRSLGAVSEPWIGPSGAWAWHWEP